jgi:hypothetical protein
VKRCFIGILALTVIATAQAHPSWGIVVARDGTLFFSDLEAIWKFDHGKLTKVREGVHGRHIHDLTLDHEGNLLGRDDRLWRMTPDGHWKYLSSPDSRGAAIRMDHVGNLYSVEQNNNTKSRTVLLKGTPAGDLSVLAGGAYGHRDGKGTNARFSNIVAMSWGPDGALYLTDGGTIRRVTLDAKVRTVASGLGRAQSPNFLWESVMGLAVRGDGTIYVADFGNRRIMKISAGGNVSIFAEEQPPWSPTGVAIAEQGDIYTLEFAFVPPRIWSGPRVRRIRPDGTATTIASVPAK